MLLVLPVPSLGDLDRVRPAARRSLALAFSARTDSLILLTEAILRLRDRLP